MNPKWWAVWIESGGKPNQQYFTYEGALARAKSLAQQTRKRVFVLEATQVVTALVPESEATFTVEEL
jgi:hypothetical protein